MFKSIMFRLHAESEETDIPYLAWVEVGGGGGGCEADFFLLKTSSSIIPMTSVDQQLEQSDPNAARFNPGLET